MARDDEVLGRPRRRQHLVEVLLRLPHRLPVRLRRIRRESRQPHRTVVATPDKAVSRRSCGRYRSMPAEGANPGSRHRRKMGHRLLCRYYFAVMPREGVQHLGSIGWTHAVRSSVSASNQNHRAPQLRLVQPHRSRRSRNRRLLQRDHGSEPKLIATPVVSRKMTRLPPPSKCAPTARGPRMHPNATRLESRRPRIQTK